LPFSHYELELLLKKVKDNRMLTHEEYKKLTEEIGLENISTFDGHYDSLIGVPATIVRVSQLFNDSKFVTEDGLEYKLEDVYNKLSDINKFVQYVENELDENNLTGFKNEINLLSSKTNTLTNNLQLIEDTLKSVSNLYARLESFEASTADDIETLENDIRINKYQISNIINNIDQIRKSVLDIGDAYDEVIYGDNGLKTDIDRINPIIADLQKQVGELSDIYTTIENLKEDNEAFNNSIKDALDSHKDIKSSLSDMSVTIENMRKEISQGLCDHTYNMDIFSYTLDLFKNRLLVIEHEITRINDSVENLENSTSSGIEIDINEVSDLAALINVNKNNISLLQNTITSLQNTITSLQKTVASNTSNITTLQSDVETNKNNIDKLDDALSNLKLINVVSQSEYDNLTQSEKDSGFYVITDYKPSGLE
jgi:chromosome segregation ATPase